MCDNPNLQPAAKSLKVVRAVQAVVNMKTESGGWSAGAPYIHYRSGSQLLHATMFSFTVMLGSVQQTYWVTADSVIGIEDGEYEDLCLLNLNSRDEYELDAMCAALERLVLQPAAA